MSIYHYSRISDSVTLTSPQIERLKANMFENIEAEDSLDFDQSPFVSEISKRCQQEGITFKTVPYGTNYFDISLGMQTNRKRIEDINLSAADECKKIIQSSFEHYKIIDGFTAIYSLKYQTIECLIHPQPGFTANRNKRHIILRTQQPILCQNPHSENMKIRIGQLSKELSALKFLDPNNLSIIIHGIPSISDDTVEDLLLTYANNILFQLESSGKYSYLLVREKPSRRLEDADNKRLVRRPPGPPSVNFPTRRLEKAPISLYWYGRNADQMPLLRFLAYYQSVEYSFPRFSKRAAHEKVQAILKNPNFRPDNDIDIEKIFKAIRLTNSGRIGDEKSQLLSVIKTCFSPSDLIEFICANPDRKAHFTTNQSSGLSKYKVNEKQKDELIPTLSNRLYEIRCKIVHTKNDVEDNEVEVVLPYSADAEKLEHDIELIKFIAEQVLNYTSEPIPR